MSLAAIGTLQSVLGIDNTVKTTEAGLQMAGEAMRGFSKEAVIAAIAQEGLTESQAVGILKAYGLSDAELQAALSALASGKAASTATVGFKTFGLAIKGAAKSLASFLLTNPVGWAIDAALVIGGVVAAYNYMDKAYERSAEKSAEVREEYQNTASEVDQINGKKKLSRK